MCLAGKYSIYSGVLGFTLAAKEWIQLALNKSTGIGYLIGYTELSRYFSFDLISIWKYNRYVLCYSYGDPLKNLKMTR